MNNNTLDYQHYDSLASIYPALEKADIIVTPTKRLARFVESYWYKHQHGSVFIRKPVESLEAWLYQLWQQISLQCDDPPVLLNLMQQHHYWFQCLNDYSPVALLNQQNTLKNLLQAWRLINEWSLSYAKIKQHAFNQDQQLLVQIIEDFQTWCNKNNYLDQQQLPPWIKQHLTPSIVETQPNLVLLDFNFTTLAPIYQQLLQTFQDGGGNLICYKRDSSPSHCHYCEFSDYQQETQHALQWLKQQVDSNPQGRFLWIVPELKSQRNQLVSYLRQTFGNDEQYAFNIGGYQPLADINLIQIALQIIQLKQNSIERSLIETLLNSPYLDQQINFPGKFALFRQAITSQLPPQIKQQQWQNYLLHQSGFISELFYQLSVKNLPQQAQPYEWAAYFHELTQLMGWPGVRPLNSAEYQALNNWHQVLDELCQLNNIANEPWSLEYAQKWLNYIAQQTPYQPQSPNTIQIDCLEPMEAVGLQYDAVWVMNAHQLAWPQPSHMNPFLPFTIQRQYDLPHAQVDREQRFYEVLIHQILALSDTIQLSYARYQANDYQCHLSPLWLKHKPLYYQPITLDNQSALPKGFLETIWDNVAPPVTEPQSIKGGSALLQAQAQCPFKAWASYRLNAKELDVKGYLISAKDKGIILHRALEHLWQHWEDQQQLQATSQHQLENIIELALQQASYPFTKQLPERLLKAELDRLHQLISKWLDYEQHYRPFFTVKSLEKQTQLTISQLPISLKIDRIDQDINGKQMLIDYKSRAPSPNYWLGERPEEPQMPLYALSQSANQQISGIAYAEISAQNIRLKGWSNQTLPHCKAPPDEWSELYKQWNKHLQNLSQQFLQGKAHLDPKRGETTCSQCHLTMFCRRLDVQNSDDNHQSQTTTAL